MTRASLFAALKAEATRRHLAFTRSHAWAQMHPGFWEPVSTTCEFVFMNRCRHGWSKSCTSGAAKHLINTLPLPPQNPACISFADGWVYDAASDTAVLCSSSTSFNHRCWRHVAAPLPRTLLEPSTPGLDAFMELNQIPAGVLCSQLGNLLHRRVVSGALCFELPLKVALTDPDPVDGIKEMLACLVPQEGWHQVVNHNTLPAWLKQAGPDCRLLLADIRGWPERAVDRGIRLLVKRSAADRLGLVVLCHTLPAAADLVPVRVAQFPPDLGARLHAEAGAIIVRCSRHYLSAAGPGA